MSATSVAVVNATKERQAWCCLQVKLCNPCLSALYVPWCEKALYKYSSFPFFPFEQAVDICVSSDSLAASACETYFLVYTLTITC